MAIATGSMYKGFTFGGISSKDYGVYISGDGVFNAPEKDVEMISIPGRNGSFALDHGRWLNIELAYPAGLFGSNETDFAQAISDLRNALASKKGYQVLEDDYHPGEFRQAIYHSGLEVTPAQLKAGEFTITFDCKPQRWLTAGQDPVTVTSGDEVENPTLFDASPLLLVEGYGSITLNGQTITIVNDPIGWVSLAPDVDPSSQPATSSGRARVFPIDTAALAAGDTITGQPDGSGVGLRFYVGGIFSSGYLAYEEQFILQRDLHALDFVKGTPDTNVINNNSMAYASFKTSDQTTHSGVIAYHIDVTYDGDSTITVTPQFVSTTVEGVTGARFYIGYGTLMGNSTLSSTGQPLYIDLDIGEAYKENDGEYINVNANAIIGAALPALVPGNNVVTYDNTVTSLQIVPRYWKL